MKALIRTKVSADRTRFEDGQYNLDLAYITDRIIAMGFPGEGLQSVWRNNIDKVSSMLKKYHNDHYKIWNLSQLKYDYEKLDNQIIEMGFPDHHNPPLGLLFEIIYSIDNWLKAHPENVAVVHCLGGKGRTGTVIASYLIYNGVYSDPIEALDHFAERRSSIKKGVTQASQRRYVEYFSKILQQRMPPYPKKMMLQKLVFHNIPCFSKSKKGFKPYLKVTSLASSVKDSNGSTWSFSSPNILFQTSTPQIKKPMFCDYSQGTLEIEINTVIQGDIMVTCSHLGKKEVKVFRCSLHTAFLNDSVLELSRHELDDIKKTDTRFDENFGVTMYFSEVYQDEEDEQDEDFSKDSPSRHPRQNSQLSQTQALLLTYTYSQIFDRLKEEAGDSPRELSFQQGSHMQSPRPPSTNGSVQNYSLIDTSTNTLLLRPLRGAEQKGGNSKNPLNGGSKLRREQISVSYRELPEKDRVGPLSPKTGFRSDTISLPLSSTCSINASPPKGTKSARVGSSIHSSYPNFGPPSPTSSSSSPSKGPRGLFSSSKSSSFSSIPVPLIYQASISTPTPITPSSTTNSGSSFDGESSVFSCSLSSSTSSTATSPTSTSPVSASPLGSPQSGSMPSPISSSLPSDAPTPPIIIPFGRGQLTSSTPSVPTGVYIGGGGPMGTASSFGNNTNNGTTTTPTNPSPSPSFGCPPSFSPSIIPKPPRPSPAATQTLSQIISNSPIPVCWKEATTPIMSSQRISKDSRIYHAHSSPGHLSQIEEIRKNSSPPNVPMTPDITSRNTPIREKSQSLNSQPPIPPIKNDFPLGHLWNERA